MTGKHRLEQVDIYKAPALLYVHEQHEWRRYQPGALTVHVCKDPQHDNKEWHDDVD